MNIGLIESQLLKQSQEVISEKVLCMKEIGFCKPEKQYGMNVVINCWLSTNTKLLPVNILTRKSKQKILQQARFFIFLFFLTSLRLPGDLVKLFTEDDNSVNPIYFILNKHFLADC